MFPDYASTEILVGGDICVDEANRLCLYVAFQKAEHTSHVFHTLYGNIAIVYLHDAVCFISSIQNQMIPAIKITEESADIIFSFHQGTYGTDLYS